MRTNLSRPPSFCLLLSSSWLAAILVCATTGLLSARPTVSEHGGNIFIVSDAGVKKQLTSSGRDSDPVLDPAGEWVVFVRRTSKEPVSSGADDHPASELWQIRADGKEPLMLVATHDAEEMENVIASFHQIQFSTDGRRVYFITAAWATSGAVHVVDTTNRKERFVVSGNDLRVVPSGEYRDHLLVSQHRYFLGGGSYDWYYLFTPAGKEVGVVGKSTANFMALYVNADEDIAAPRDKK